MNFKKIIATIVFLFFMIISFSTNSHAIKDGWDSNGEQTYYYKNGKKVMGWQTIDGKKYYFNPNFSGSMSRGSTYVSNGDYYYFDKNTGALIVRKDTDNGWYKFKEEVYYVRKDNKLQIGKFILGNKEYFFDSEGEMHLGQRYDHETDRHYFYKNDGVKVTNKGWYCLDPKNSYANWYYANEGGVLKTGWADIEGKRYYFSKISAYRYNKLPYISGVYDIDDRSYIFREDGSLVKSGWYFLNKGSDFEETYYVWKNNVLAKGLSKINGKFYYFNEITGLKEDIPSGIDPKKYLFDKEGKLVRDDWYVEKLSGKQKKYYADKDGKYLKGFQSIKGYTYYFNNEGVMQTGFKKINGKVYAFTDSGKMVTGWRTIAENKYYFRKDGVMHTGWLKLGNKTYVFTDSGKMVTGWRKISGNKYYFRKDGVMHTGWLKLGNKTYVFTDSGKMVTGWRKISGNKYYFRKDGVMHRGWLKLGNKTYVFTDSGKMVIGWKIILGSKYYFGKDGVIHKGWLHLNGKTYYLQVNGKIALGTIKINNKTYNFRKDGTLIK